MTGGRKKREQVKTQNKCAEKMPAGEEMAIKQNRGAMETNQSQRRTKEK